MLRTHTCGELTIKNEGTEVSLCGWVQRSRDLGGMTFIDLRDRYGITQLVFNMETNSTLCEKARAIGREFVIKARGKVVERSNKNPNLPTGEIEITVSDLEVLNPSKIPPFTIEDESDGGEELRMQYRYLDLRRKPLKKNLELRHEVALETRKYLDSLKFIEIETPFLIKSTPEGARDFVVPSRVHQGQFYALPQSPQTFKQILMVSGYDRYFQIVRCFRDEDLRADRQPEFTQIDCEMSFIEQEDILKTFEGLTRHLFKKIKGIELGEFPRMTYDDAMKHYGSDKPDTRFKMKFIELKSPPAGNKVLPFGENLGGAGFKVFDEAEIVIGICASGCANYSRKQLDALTEFVKRPQIGAKGLVYAKYNEDGTIKSSADKFFNEEALKKWAAAFSAKPGDLMLILAGDKDQTRKALNELRLEMGNQLGLRKNDKFSPLWVIDFPLLECLPADTGAGQRQAGNEELKRWHAMHHPFTSPKKEDVPFLESNPGKVRANAYDMVINGVELGGGSIRIHDKELQKQMFKILGFTEEEAQRQFGFLMNAFEYGAPPHGGIAFGFDRLCAMFGGSESIRDYIAFPKNNAGRDMMIDAPSEISKEQLKELGIL